MKEIIEYLERTYAPLGMILYGSYCDGTQDCKSDFDCLLICYEIPGRQDTSHVDLVPLDVYLYTAEELRSEIDPYEFLQIHDGRILKDTEGLAAGLLEKVRAYVRQQPKKTEEEKKASLQWCRKMLDRASRGDTEGDYRCHKLLCESLEIYCELTEEFFFGPKKTLQQMKRRNPQGFAYYADALKNGDLFSIDRWLQYLESFV